jgi:hypothetical protein
MRRAVPGASARLDARVGLGTAATSWRRQANTATLESLREFCLAQAEECERRVHQSKTAPVLRDRARLIGTT